MRRPPSRTVRLNDEVRRLSRDCDACPVLCAAEFYVPGVDRLLGSASSSVAGVKVSDTRDSP